MICNTCKLYKPTNTNFKGYFNKTCRACDELINNGYTPKDLSKTHKFCHTCTNVLPLDRFVMSKTSVTILYSKQCDTCKPRKKCIDCNCIKPLTSYNKKGKKSGEQKYEPRCSSCRKIFRKKADIRKRRSNEQFLCRCCTTVLPDKDFYPRLKTDSTRTGICKKCQNEKCYKNTLASITELRPQYLRVLLNSRIGTPTVYAGNQTSYDMLMGRLKKKLKMERKIRTEVQQIKKRIN